MLYSVYITSKNAVRHIKKAFQRRSFPGDRGGGESLKDKAEASIISLTTMSFETALAITNQKTIKYENKDKLKGLCFHGMNTSGASARTQVCMCSVYLVEVCVCVRASEGELVSGYLCVIMYVRPS